MCKAIPKTDISTIMSRFYKLHRSGALTSTDELRHYACLYLISYLRFMADASICRIGEQWQAVVLFEPSEMVCFCESDRDKWVVVSCGKPEILFFSLKVYTSRRKKPSTEVST